MIVVLMYPVLFSIYPADVESASPEQRACAVWAQAAPFKRRTVALFGSAD